MLDSLSLLLFKVWNGVMTKMVEGYGKPATNEGQQPSEECRRGSGGYATFEHVLVGEDNDSIHFIEECTTDDKSEQSTSTGQHRVNDMERCNKVLCAPLVSVESVDTADSATSVSSRAPTPLSETREAPQLVSSRVAHNHSRKHAHTHACTAISSKKKRKHRHTRLK